MNKHSKRKFTTEFKFKVALEALQEKQTLAEIASNGAAVRYGQLTSPISQCRRVLCTVWQLLTGIPGAF